MAQTDPPAQAAAFEDFAARYPQSRLKREALEKAMAAWLVDRDFDKVDALAQRVLALEPDNVRALAMRVIVLRAKAAAATPEQTGPLTAEAGRAAERGLALLPKWAPEQGASADDATAVKAEMTAVFEGALGFRALKTKDFAAAAKAYKLAVRADPSGLDDTYQLALSLLLGDPLDPTGFWWAARADALAVSQQNANAQSAIETYVKPLYASYHGDDSGWGVMLSQAETASAPPSDFSVKPAPTPAAVAVQAAQDTPVAALSFDQWEVILSQRDTSADNHAAADKVWAFLAAMQTHGARMRFPARVIAVSPGELDVAVSDASQKAGRADIKVMLQAPLSPTPAVGSAVAVTGLLSGYAPKPFAFTMQAADVSGL